MHKVIQIQWFTEFLSVKNLLFRFLTWSGFIYNCKLEHSLLTMIRNRFVSLDWDKSIIGFIWSLSIDVLLILYLESNKSWWTEFKVQFISSLQVSMPCGNFFNFFSEQDLIYSDFKVIWRKMEKALHLLMKIEWLC